MRAFFFILLLCALGAGQAAQVDAADPKAPVEKLHTTLLEIMREADTLGYGGRFDRIAPVVSEVFDLLTIARLTLGRHWRALDDAQHAGMVDTFSHLSAATYASRFDGYSGQQFETIEAQPLKKGRVVVKTRLKETSGDAVTLDYVVQPTDGEWRIVNVIADGVSDLSLKRADYSSIIAARGFDALISSLEKKIADYEAAPAN